MNGRTGRPFVSDLESFDMASGYAVRRASLGHDVSIEKVDVHGGGVMFSILVRAFTG